VLPFVKGAQVQRIEVDTVAYLIVEVRFIVVLLLYYHRLLPALVGCVVALYNPTYLITDHIVYLATVSALVFGFDMLILFVILVFNFHYCLIEAFYGLILLLLLVLLFIVLRAQLLVL